MNGEPEQFTRLYLHFECNLQTARADSKVCRAIKTHKELQKLMNVQ